jgi:AbrB family looped-hinge helix DNA binding protein
MTVTATLSSKGQITIPAKFRKMLDLGKNQKLDIAVDSATDTITIRKQETLHEALKRIRSYNDPEFVAKYAGMTANEIREALMKTADGQKEIREKYGQ